jgi:hypothetical protein
MTRRAAPKADAPTPGPPLAIQEIPVTTHFNKIFYAILGLTVLCLLISGVIAWSGSDTVASRDVVKTSLAMAQIGLGAIAGLFGGKAA